VATPDPADPLLRARLHPVADEVLSPEPPWLATLPHGEPGLSRVAALGQNAQAALRAGQAGECLAALDEQRAAAGNDPPSLVWALTVSAVCRSTLGQLARSRADLAEARQNCLYAAPLLAQPFWRFAEIVCNWMGGNWAAASSDASTLYADQVAPITPALSGVVLALRTELLRGLGLPRESRALAERLPPTAPAELTVWARAGLDADHGQGAEALRDLADVYGARDRSMYRAALPLVLHRMATIAFGRGDRRVTASAAAALAELDQAAPLAEILTGVVQAYATGDPEPARRAQQLAEAEGAAMLTAEALTARGQVGDDPARTLAAAHAAWERIGAPGRVAGVAAIMRGAGLAVPAPGVGAAGVPATGPALLTARERSVAVLVHEGRTNQQIAHALNISVKTVEAYLTRLYRKTSCSSRVELAVAVTERRLIIADGTRKDAGTDVSRKDDAAGPA
jgi:DNA-binding CsgD family transcriptional regulator